MTNSQQKAIKELNRAKKSLLAAKTLLEHELYEDSVSRAYYVSAERNGASGGKYYLTFGPSTISREAPGH